MQVVVSKSMLEEYRRDPEGVAQKIALALRAQAEPNRYTALFWRWLEFFGDFVPVLIWDAIQGRERPQFDTWRNHGQKEEIRTALRGLPRS